MLLIFGGITNPIQQHIDGFDQVEGKHITSLYVPYDLKCIPTIECLQKGKPLLHKIYTYKATTHMQARTMTDFFPLFDNGIKDGVLAFTTWLDEAHFTSKCGIQKENCESKSSRTSFYTFDDFIGKDKILRQTIESAHLVAGKDSPVIIWGESGTGKEVFAQAIHSASRRKDKPFVAVNCAAIPETLLESILFGTTKGAYTDASNKPGLFEEANQGTLLLDELNSMPLGLQAKLLRVLQEKKVRRLGAHEEIPVDVRIISILNQHPLQAVEQNILRRDVFYRLAVSSLTVPPLRERKNDIPLLAEVFIANCGYKKIKISNTVLHMFSEYHWPGNVRELEHVIEGSLVTAASCGVIDVTNLPIHFLESYHLRGQESTIPAILAGLVKTHDELPPQEQPYFDYGVIQRGAVVPLKQCMNDYEKSCISNVLRVTGGNVAKAARMMEITSAGLRYRIKTLKIDDNCY